MADQQAPGAEFLLHRLARAEAVPPAERSPEVAAFLEIVHLLREVRHLLPLTSDGQPALPPNTPAAQQQVQLAFLKFARASYLCPVMASPVADVNWSTILAAYLPPELQQLLPDEGSTAGTSGSSRKGASCVGGSSGLGDSDTGSGMLAPSDEGDSPPAAQGTAEALPRSLALTCAAEMLLEHEGNSVLAMQLGQEAAALLAHPDLQQPLSQQLQQLSEAAGQAEPPLLALPQLQHTVYCTTAQATTGVAKRAGEEGPGDLSPLSHGQRLHSAQAQAVLGSCAARLASLEPHSLKTRMMVAHDAAAPVTSWESPGRQRAVELFLGCSQQAQQQRCDYTVASAGMYALAMVASDVSRTCSAAVQGSALAAFQQAEAALRRCKRVLPQPWLAQAEVVLREMQHRQMPQQLQLQMQLQLPAQSTEPVFLLPSHVLPPSMRGDDAVDISGQMANASKCAGCGGEAVGLRRCAACHRAFYCRWAGSGAAVLSGRWAGGPVGWEGGIGRL